MWVEFVLFVHLFGRFTISVLGKFCPGQLGPSVRDPIHPNEVDVPGQNLEPQVPLPPLALSPDFCLFFMGFFFGFLFSSFFLLFLFCHLAAGLTQQGFHRSPETQKQIRQFWGVETVRQFWDISELQKLFRQLWDNSEMQKLFIQPCDNSELKKLFGQFWYAETV